ncbi:AAA family ATPase [Ornithinimicrobium tianjinense]|uniref:Response regulatory domain-containing protein n=1 Tax=Ornithinimicrobium tianjinense TaxID=1195761 RepID=A0A917BIE8_9MICO|nr:AAA family ATPase [Ornithinimicrobium tianjinense]GGF44664.1 hypothetical protein GCM10011366_10500 [Ornithinimicrobium tianjinense]
MTHIVTASSSTELTKRIRLAAEDALTVLRPEQVPATPGQLLALFEDQVAVSTVVLDVTPGQMPVEQAIELTRRLCSHAGAPSVLLVSDEPEAIALAAMRAGGRDVLTPEVSIEELRAVLREAQEMVGYGTASDGSRPEQGDGRVITVASPKGGVGKTTLATNIALALARTSPQGTVLVDLDVQFGDVAAALDLDPSYTLGDVATSAVPDIIGLKALLTQHPSGLQVIAGVRSPVEADRIDPRLVGDLLDVLRREFRYVVVDSAPGMSEETLTALDHTSDLVLVSTLDVPGIRGLRKELDLLSELALPAHTRHVILNMVDRAGGLTVDDAEATLGVDADLVLPRSPKVARSTNQGVPIVELFPSDKVSQDIQSLVTRFAPLSSRRERRLGAHRIWGRS